MQGTPFDLLVASGSTDVASVAARRPILEVTGVSHSYGGAPAVENVSLTVARGEFLTLLGPSGSGKTTLLRIIAGLEQPTAIAELRLAGRDVRATPAEERNVVTVFQHFALFPHMSVRENVEYGLRVRRRPAEERRRRAFAALAMVHLETMADRRIHQLSGGEKQRVALARAFVTEPDVLLLDEPLGSLDENLRLAMQAELTDLHRRLGATFVLVTHSQEEAITMSDRIVLMRGGRVVQQGAPAELFERPASRFAARFMGVENILDGHVRAVEGGRVVLSVGDVMVTGTPLSGWRPSPGEAAFAAVRAEHVRLEASDAGLLTGAALPGQVAGRVYKGKFEDWTVNTPVGPLTGRVWDTAAAPAAVKVVGWPAERCIMGPADEGVRH